MTAASEMETRQKYFVFILLYIILMGEVLSSIPCTNTEECQDIHRICSTGACVCKPGMVAWKWECHPLVGLGEPCITSAQCKSQVTPSHVCNPINHKCSCERGFTPTVDGQLGLVCRMVNEAQHLEQPVHYSSTDAGNTSHPVQYRHTQPVHSTQPVTWVLLAALVLGTPAAVLVLALYLKTLREKRASQARVQSLLRIVAEQNDIRPSLTSLTSFTTSLGMEEEEVDMGIYQHKEEQGVQGPDWRSSFTMLTDCPPPYEDLLK